MEDVVAQSAIRNFVACLIVEFEFSSHIACRFIPSSSIYGIYGGVCVARPLSAKSLSQFSSRLRHYHLHSSRSSSSVANNRSCIHSLFVFLDFHTIERKKEDCTITAVVPMKCSSIALSTTLLVASLCIPGGDSFASVSLSSTHHKTNTLQSKSKTTTMRISNNDDMVAAQEAEARKICPLIPPPEDATATFEAAMG